MSHGERPDYLSHSQLSTYLQCGKKYELSYLYDFERVPQGALIAGSAVHDSIEEAENQGWHSENAAKKGGPLAEFFHVRLDERIDEEANGDHDAVRWSGRKTKQYPNGEDYLWWKANGPMMLRRYTAIRRDDFDNGWLPPSDDYVEINVMAELPFGRPLKGLIDLLLVNDDGEYVVRDWKTGRPNGAAYTIQLPTYAWVARETLGLTPTWGQYAYLKAKDPKKQIVEVEMTPAKYDLVTTMFEQAEVGIADDYFPICPSSFCKSCDVRPQCPYGSTLEV